MQLVCLDTQILIWGIKNEATAGQEALIPKAQAFLKHLDKNQVQVLIPSIVIAEFLMRIPPEAHATIGNLIQRSFVVAPFDLQASAHFARLWQLHHAVAEAPLAGADTFTRSALKADCMIVAAAIARGADCIYSYDKGLKKFANGQIEVLPIPDILEQATFL